LDRAHLRMESATSASYGMLTELRDVNGNGIASNRLRCFSCWPAQPDRARHCDTLWLLPEQAIGSASSHREQGCSH